MPFISIFVHTGTFFLFGETFLRFYLDRRVSILRSLIYTCFGRESAKIAMEGSPRPQSQFKECKTCHKEMNSLDNHEECFLHRVCNRAFPCATCAVWSEERRAIVEKMIDKKRAAIGHSSATVTSENNQNMPLRGTSADSPVSGTPLMGVTTGTSAIPLMGNNANTFVPQVTGAGTSAVPLMGNNTSTFLPQIPQFQPQILPWGMGVGSAINQNDYFQKLIDERIRQIMKPPTTCTTPVVNVPVQPPATLGNNNPRSSKRFDRFQRSEDHESESDSDTVSVNPDVLDLTDPNNNIDQMSVAQSESHETASIQDSSEAPDMEFKAFMSKVASELGVPITSNKSDHQFQSFVSERLLSTKERQARDRLKCSIPLDGSVLKTLHDVDEEWQTKKRVRTYKAADDMRYTVSSDHFSQYCSTPRLDDNIEEGIMDSSRRNNPSGGKSHFKLSNKQLQTSDSALYKIDQEARLLLREISYGSIISSYLDRVVSDEDKTEALKAMVQVFQSMADVTCVLVNAVTARRGLYLQDMMFKNKATENKLSTLSAIGPQLFMGKFFDVLHSSAENIRDAKETQHLRNLKSQTSRNDGSSNKRKAGNDQNSDKPNYPPSKKSKSGSKGHYDRSKNYKGRRDNRSRGDTSSRNTSDDPLGFRPSK